MSFYFQNDSLKFQGADIERLSKALRRSLKHEHDVELTQPDMLEMVARALGAKNLHSARMTADDPVIAGWSQQQIDEAIKKRAISTGKEFPQELVHAADREKKRNPERHGPFTSSWLERATQLFSQAEASAGKGRLRIIAVVGSKGAGKSVLISHMVRSSGGLVIDTSLNPLENGRFVNGQPRAFKPGSLLAYDRPVIDDPAKPFEGLRALASGSINRLSQYQALTATKLSGIPHDDRTFGHLRNWLLENPDVTLVVAFESLDEAANAIAGRALRANGQPASGHWEMAIAVDLDNMELVNLENTPSGVTATTSVQRI